MTPLWIFAQYLSYNTRDGTFRWVKRSTRRVRIGDVAGTEMRNGYIKIALFGTQVLAHRLAWAFVNGYWPPSHLDHINGNRTDNRIDNLRLANKSQNAQNAIKPSHGITSSFKGVDWDATRRRWRVQICHNKERRFIGRFSSEEVAGATYDWLATLLFAEYAKPNGDVVVLC